ncbi:M24 family metallopeptidase [Roseobacter ponti]|uniref:Aminopeptidase P family protein n=1 Tax=Roseobacter ponti TaxID=1891787 RepID=A0A858SUZ3_9RHOB|nr:Xaa-Pro peptidase family protein [Roseobacter ponti]QJF51652.1 aminopeptidase P family protein [Roseobacter ponti]
MSEARHAFAVPEHQRRCAALQTSMQSAGMDALLLTSPADIFYVTGFLTRFWESPARPWFVLVPASGAPVAVIPSIGEKLMGTTWISDIRTWDAPDPRDDGISLLADTLCAMVPQKGRLGIPMGPETHLRMPLADFLHLSDLLAPRDISDATRVIQQVREIKSEVEVDRIRASCRIAGTAFERVPDIAGYGIPLDHVFRDFQVALLAAGADWVSYLAGGAGPGGYDDVISPAGADPLRAGDLLMLDTGAVRQGYFCDFDRNFAVRHADDGTRRTYDALWAATQTVLSDLRPGMRASDVHSMLTGSLRASGVTPGGGRLGHGLGITLTEWPSFTPLDHSELRAGMVLTIEPGALTSGGRMMVHEENIVLRDTGPELLTARAPATLPVLD